MKSLAILLIVCGLTLSSAFKDAQGLAERASMESHWDAMIPREARLPPTKCEKEREKALQLANQGMIVGYIPQCTPDGAYKPMQCSGSSGYCWCVDKVGIEIPGTARGPTEERPTCD